MTATYYRLAVLKGRIEAVDRLGTGSSSLTGESVVGMFNPLSLSYTNRGLSKNTK